MVEIKTRTGETIPLEKLIEKSDIIKPMNLKPKNNVLRYWVPIFEAEAKK